MMPRVERTLHQDTNLCYGANLQNNFSQMGNENVLESDNIPSIFEVALAGCLDVVLFAQHADKADSLQAGVLIGWDRAKGQGHSSGSGRGRNMPSRGLGGVWEG